MGATELSREQLEAQFNRAHMSRKDFDEASDYLRSSRKGLKETTQRALLLSALIAYSRPFIGTRNGNHSKATSVLSGKPKSIFSTEELRLHEKILSLRNEALAHSSFERKPSGRVKGIGRGFLVTSKPFDLLSEHIDIKLLRLMCKKMTNHCCSKMFELNALLENSRELE